jgi:hypothetical protein
VTLIILLIVGGIVAGNYLTNEHEEEMVKTGYVTRSRMVPSGSSLHPDTFVTEWVREGTDKKE